MCYLCQWGFKAIKGAILIVKTAFEASKIKHQHHQRKARLEREDQKIQTRSQQHPSSAYTATSQA
jgi:hypothetical protein